MRNDIQMKMIGWELIQNNNIICIFLRKLNYFSSISMIFILGVFDFEIILKNY